MEEFLTESNYPGTREQLLIAINDVCFLTFKILFKFLKFLAQPF